MVFNSQKRKNYEGYCYLDMDYTIVSGLLNALCKKGVVKHVEDRKSASGRGKPTKVFEVDQKITLELFSTNK